MDKKSYLVVVLAAFFYAVYLIVNRTYLVEGLNPTDFACGSGIFAALFSLMFLITSNGIKELNGLDKRDRTCILILGIVVGFFFRLILFIGQSLTTATSAGFLLRTAPVFALGFGYVLMQESIGKKQILMMLMMLSGVYLLTTNGTVISDPGDLLLILGGSIIGFDQAFSRKLMKKGISPGVLTASTTIIGATALFLFVMFFSGFSFLSWGIYLLSGFLIFISVFLRNLGLRQIKASIVSSVLLLNPLFTAVMGITLLCEKITLIQLSGGVIILVGGYLIIRKRA
ncbi:MAG: DMT family transporter [Candidatus Altiarchaeota archaeon]|nr:DMT family transporter [Candidatus Altiarchaeota archaeon]